MNAAMEMPKYKSHKTVWALKIADVDTSANTIMPEDSRYAIFEVPTDYMQRHNPQAGGYYVVYEDGYKSYSPAAAFEGGYHPFTPETSSGIAQVGDDVSLAPAGETGSGSTERRSKSPSEWIGLTAENEPKYAVHPTTGQICNRETLKPIGPLEPIFILRAQDRHSVVTLKNYKGQITDDAFKGVILKRIDQFTTWQTEHPDSVKVPD